MNRHSTLWLALLFGALLALAGCGSDDGGGGGGETDAGNATDTGGTDTGGTDTGGTDTGGTCETPCAGNGQCGVDEFCNAEGCCQSRPPVTSCTRSGQECESASYSNETFFCSMQEGGGLGTCQARCDTGTPTASDDNGCPTGSFCFDTGEAQPVVNQTTGATLDGACLESDCLDSCFAVGGDCSAEDLYTCSAGAGTCFAVGNGASFCVEGGTQGEGQTCSGALAGEANEVCAAGLRCRNGECIAPCAYDDGDPAAGCDAGECVPVFDQAGENTPGICTSVCDAYSAGDCADGEFCVPNIGSFSTEVLNWTCDEQADVTVVEFDAGCDPDGEDNICPEGSLCVPNIDDDTTGHCEALCDPTFEGEGELAFCPAGEPEPVFGEDYIDALTDYAAVTAGTQMVSAYVEPVGEADAELLASGNMTVTEGEAGTTVAHISSYTPGEGEADPTIEYGLTSFTDWTGSDTLESGKAGLHIYNLSGMDVDVVSPVDLDATYEDDEEWVDVDSGAAGQFIGDLADTTRFEGVWEYAMPPLDDADALYDAYEVVLSGNTTDGIAAIWLPNAPAALDSDRAAVRVLNASGASVYLDWDDADGVSNDLDGDLADGVVTEWAVVDTTGLTGPLNIDVKDTSEGTTALAYSSSLSDQDVLTVVIYTMDTDTKSLPLAGVGDPADDMIAVRVSNVAADELEYRLGEPVDSIADGTAWSADGEDPGDWSLVFFAADAAAGDEALTWDDFATTADEISGSALFIDGNGDYLFEGGSAAVPDLGSLAAGEGLSRFLNLTSMKLRLESGGVSPFVCVDLGLFGLEDGQLGRCQFECAPYDGGWEENGCPHSDDVSYACLGYQTGNDNEEPFAEEGDPRLTGFCIPRVADDATDAAGTTCEGDANCNPGSFCAGTTSGTNECGQLCQPFNNDTDDCPEGQVCGVTLSRSVSVCADPSVDANIGDACTAADQFLQCDDHNTFCLPTSATAQSCEMLCLLDVDESCPEGWSCSREGLNPALRPVDVGICSED